MLTPINFTPSPNKLLNNPTPTMPTAPILLLLVIFVPFLSYAAPTPESLTEIETLTSFKLNLFDPLGALNAWDPSVTKRRLDDVMGDIEVWRSGGRRYTSPAGERKRREDLTALIPCVHWVFAQAPISTGNSKHVHEYICPIPVGWIDYIGAFVISNYRDILG
ncbi:hypothetical protein LguiB_015712 [Lonicera macranthoides]